MGTRQRHGSRGGGSVKIHIESELKLGVHLPEFSQDEIEAEPMLHKADCDFAMRNGGPITRAFLQNLNWHTNDWDAVLIDSRVHMLMPGMIPCIPGWHHDDVPREREDGQPNYINPSYKSEHCLALFGDCSRTEFAVGAHEIEVPEIGCKIYKSWHPQVESLCEAGTLKRRTAPVNRLVFFDWQTWHRGTEATKNGFRFFIRATRNSNRTPRNKIRRQANVYMPVIEEGW